MARVTATLGPAGRLPSRRDWLRLGLPAVFGGGLASAGEDSPTGHGPGFGRAKSVLVVFTSGGQSQLDTWDPKPNAPEEIRGIFRTTQTTLPGLRVCEHMPRLAKLAHRYTVVRSMTHDDLDHGSACYLALTGQFHQQQVVEPAAAADRLSRARRGANSDAAREAVPAHGGSRQRPAARADRGLAGAVRRVPRSRVRTGRTRQRDRVRPIPRGTRPARRMSVATDLSARRNLLGETRPGCERTITSRDRRSSW